MQALVQAFGQGPPEWRDPLRRSDLKVPELVEPRGAQSKKKRLPIGVEKDTGERSRSDNDLTHDAAAAMSGNAERDDVHLLGGSEIHDQSGCSFVAGRNQQRRCRVVQVPSHLKHGDLL